MSRRRRSLTRLLAGLVVATSLTAGPVAAAGPDRDLAVAAARNGMTEVALERLLRQDSTARLDDRGRLHYVDPAPDRAGRSGPLAEGPVAPLASTFALHSRPSAARKIFLDVDGAAVAGTAWAGVLRADEPGWDPAGDGPQLSVDEQVMLQQVWAMVAEDFAPFDVDVTTEDPGEAGIVRASAGDTSYGTRVAVTSGTAAWAALCKSTCGGIAYVDVFDTVGGLYQPAWVFARGLGDSVKNVAEAASHEAGHTLGLDHDASTGTDYYEGHGTWAPVMGSGYGRPVVQWSQGSYPGASNREDDVSILTSRLALAPDEAPTPGTAAPSLGPTGAVTGVITHRDDVDTWALGACRDDATVTVSPAAISPNLDVAATLRDATGAVVGTSDPPAGYVDRGHASGLEAALPVPVGSGWTISVDGTGHGSWMTEGYDDYGSLGSYTVTTTGCDPASATAPGAPTAVAVTPGDRTAQVSWSPPANDGGLPVSGYTVTAAPGGATVTVAAPATSATLTNLANGVPYTFTVRAQTAAGTSEPSRPSAAVTLAGVPARVARPRTAVRPERTVVRWSAPDANGSPVLAYRVSVSRHGLVDVAGTSTSTVLRGMSPGRHRIRVSAVNAVGVGLPSAAAVLRLR